jgi:hypothetical protein
LIAIPAAEKLSSHEFPCIEPGESSEVDSLVVTGEVDLEYA